MGMLYQSRCRAGSGIKVRIVPIQPQKRVNAMQTQCLRMVRGLGGCRLVGLIVMLGTLILTSVTALAVENWFEIGLADLKEQHYQAAVDKFTKAIEAVPDDFEALNNRGFARIYTGDYEGAIEDCTRSLAISPGSAKAYNNRGFARLFTGEFDAAIADFNQALTINPRYVDAYSNRCLAWTRKTVYAEAIADCTEALHLNPRSAKALYNRGYALDRQGNPGAAMRDYIQALKINPGYIEVLNNMAWIMATSPDARLRDGRRAVAYAEKTVGNTPDINFLDTLAAAYAENGRFDEAVAIENRIISLLASTRQTDAIALHAQRLSIYEEKRPYRDPIQIQPVSAVTDLQGELAALDALVLETAAATPAGYTAQDADGLTAAVPADGKEASRSMLLAQAKTEPPVTVPEAESQTVQTAPGVPVEITLNAVAAGIPLTFEIETVPYQGSLQGTLPHLLYTPRPGFAGQDRFTFRARNAVGSSNLATVTITVAEPAPPAEATPSEDVPPEDVPPPPEQAPIEEAPLTAPETEAPVAAPVTKEEAPAAEAPAVSSPQTDQGLAAAPPPAPALPAPATESAPEATTEPAPKPVPATAPAPRRLYTIQVRSVKEAAGAKAVVAKLRAEGYAAFSYAMEVPEKGVWQRIFINTYPTPEAAKAALDGLDAKHFKGAFVRRVPSGANVPAMAPDSQPALPAETPAPPPAPASPPAAPNPVPTDAPAPESPMPAAPDTVPQPPAAAPVGERETGGGSGPPAIAVAAPRFLYAYQVKSYQQKEDAFQLGVELTTQGHRAYIGRGVMGSTGVWYRVYIGCYQTPEEAEKNRAEIRREGFPEAFLTPIAFAIAVRGDDGDPAGKTLENRLMASGFLPYRLPGDGPDQSPSVLVGGFRDAEDATQVLAELKQAGFQGAIRPR